MMFDKQLLRHPWLLPPLLAHRIRNDSLLRNSIFIMSTNVVTAAFGYLFWIVAAHIYSPHDVGLGAALIAVMTLASTLGILGIDATLVQKLPRRESGHEWSLTLNAGMATGMLSGLLTGAIVVVILPLFSPQFAIVQHHIGYIVAFIVGVPVMIVSILLDQAFIAERAAHNKLVRQLVIAALKIPLMVLPVVFIGQAGALGILLAGILSMAVMLFGGLVLLLRLGRGYCLALRGIVGQVRSMFSSLVGNNFINLGGVIPLYLLPVLVAARLSPTANAYYYTADRVGSFFFVASSAVAVSLFAEGSHTSHNLSRKVRSSAAIIGMIFGPGMLICLLGGRYILLVFGSDYAQHGLLLLRIAAVAAIPDAITNVYMSVLRVQNRLRFAALINLGMGVLTLVLAWILLPIVGIAGAELAFLVAQTCGSLMAGVDVIRNRRCRLRGSNGAIQIDSGHTEIEASNQEIAELPGEVTY